MIFLSQQNSQKSGFLLLFSYDVLAKGLEQKKLTLPSS